MLSDPLLVMVKLSRVFDTLGVDYLVGGSMASATYGIYRPTQDVDLVATLRPRHARLLVAALQDEFYVDEQMILDAIRTTSSFNVIHLSTMDKADIFVPEQSPWAEEEMRRRRRQPIETGDIEAEVCFASPEDTVLQKLRWYRMGGGTSERQWNDIVGVLKVQAESIDRAYMTRWARDLKLTELLERATDDAGLTA